MSEFIQNELDKRTQALLKFISGYSEPESPQSVDEIKGDFQLASLGPVLNSCFSSGVTPRVLDIGCGKGILIKKLVEFGIFDKYPTFEYYGFDFQDMLLDAFSTATKLKIATKIKLVPFEEVDWFDFAIDPCVVVIRNVFHELSIKEAAKLLHEICLYLPKGSKVLIQDMTTFPVVEKGRAGWFGNHLQEILIKGGIEAIFTPDESRSGVILFLICGKQCFERNLTEDEILKLLIEARREQLEILKSKYVEMKEDPDNRLSFTRIIHDIAAISISLDPFIDGILEDMGISDEQVVSSSFSLAFNSFSDSNVDELKNKFKYPQIIGFQNRGHQIEELDKFLCSDKTVFILKSVPLMGKKTVVWWALDQKIRHERLPVYVNFQENDDLISILEKLSIKLEIGRFVDVDVLSSLKCLPLKELKLIIEDFVNRFSKEIILILDGFENILDSESKIEDQDITWFINCWSSNEQSKLIIETRLNFSGCNMQRCYPIEYLSTFPRAWENDYKYIVQMLNKLVPVRYRFNDSEASYPFELLDAIDNNPYLAYVAGIIIRNNCDSNCLYNPNFIQNIIFNLYEQFIDEFDLNEKEKEIAYHLNLVQGNFPLKLINLISEDNEIGNKLLEKGLLIENEPGLFRLVGILKYSLRVDKREEAHSQRLQKWNQIFSDAFKRLYQIDSNPSFYRQYYYHSLLAGNEVKLTDYQLPQLSNCIESWFESQDYNDCLWACKETQQRRHLTAKEKMRMGGCLIRLGKVEEGSSLYENLLDNYENWVGVRYSYADSLLFVGGYAKKALSVLLKVSDYEGNALWHHKAARCYKQLGIRDKAYDEYEKAIFNSTNSNAWKIIKEYISYARDVADDSVEEEWLNHAWNDRKIKINEVRIYLGSYFERINELEKAELFLHEAYNLEPKNAYCILPLIKLLCKTSRITEAESVLESSNKAIPKEVFLYAKVSYLQKVKRFPDCERELTTLFMRLGNRINIDHYGQWADLFVRWCETLWGNKRIEKANRGLKYVHNIIEEKNVPAMLACWKLSKFAGNFELQKELEGIIHEENSSVLLK